MSMDFTLGLIFLSAAGIVLSLGLWSRRRLRRRDLVRSLREEPATVSHLRPRRTDPWLARVGRKTKNQKKKQDRDLALKLVRAGWDTRTAPLTYSALRLSLLLTLPLLAVVLTYAANRTQGEMLLAGGLALVVGFLLPELVLSRRTRQRKKRVRKSLADTLDLMVVCVEAGVGLDAAILRVAEELQLTHPDIAHEFRVVNRRVNAGMPRMDALREMVARTGVDDLRSIVTTLIQSEKLGVSIGRVLRVAAEGLRTRRRQAAEQAARKAPIKMLIPLILFVLPALVLVIMGPAAMHIVRIMRTTAP